MAGVTAREKDCVTCAQGKSTILEVALLGDVWCFGCGCSNSNLIIRGELACVHFVRS